MSVQDMAMVWSHSKLSGTELLMLLAIADHINDRGVAYPSINGLALKCRTTPRHATRLLTALRASGELSVQIGSGPGGKSLYRITLSAASTPPTDTSPPDMHVALTPTSPPPTDTSPPDVVVTPTPTSAPPDVHVRYPLTPTSPESPMNHQEPSEHVRARKPKQTTLPNSFGVSDGVKVWAQQKGFGDLEVHLESFSEKALAKGYTYADWDAAFKKAVREDWAGLRKGPTTATHTTTASAKPTWALTAGFANRFEAENAGCFEHNAKTFRAGKRLEAHA